MINRRARGSAAAVVMLAVASVAANQAEASAVGFGASWQMNEKSGAVVDSSGNGNNGTVHGGVTRTGSGYRFDGRTGYVTVPNSPSLNPGAGDISITVGFSLAGNPRSGEDYDLVRKGLAGTRGGDYRMEVLDKGRAFCRFGGSNAAATLTGGTNLGVGTHTVSCVKTSNKIALYVDSVSKDTKTVTIGTMSNSEPVILAAKPGDDFTNGLIDYIKIT